MGAGASPVFMTAHYPHQQRYPIISRNRKIITSFPFPFPSKSNSNSSNTGVPVPPVAVVMNEAASITSDTAQISWQIVVGALAGVTPFVVAGIEFGKRIDAQRKCKTCRGSGLVLRDNKYYFRCPSGGVSVGFCHGTHGLDSSQVDRKSN